MRKLLRGSQILRFEQRLDMAYQDATPERLPDKHAWRIAGMMPNPCQSILSLYSQDITGHSCSEFIALQFYVEQGLSTLPLICLHHMIRRYRR